VSQKSRFFFLELLILEELLEHGQGKGRLILRNHVTSTIDGNELELIISDRITSFVLSMDVIRLREPLVPIGSGSEREREREREIESALSAESRERERLTSP
jgi:hypothetical protein